MTMENIDAAIERHETYTDTHGMWILARREGDLIAVVDQRKSWKRVTLHDAVRAITANEEEYELE